MWWRRAYTEYRRRRALVRAPAGPMRDYLSHPLPPGRRPCRAQRFVSLDLETTGLDPARDGILSIGLVEIRGLEIPLGSAWHQLVRTAREIPESSAVIHRITDDRAAGGRPLAALLPELLGRLGGAVLVVHHARVEQGFLDAACRRLYATPFVALTVDTQALARRTLARRDQPPAPNALRLANLRERYHLPRYPAHDALSDALATAELLLAMVAERGGAGRCRLADLIT